jgi:hypothetical protein
LSSAVIFTFDKKEATTVAMAYERRTAPRPCRSERVPFKQGAINRLREEKENPNDRKCSAGKKAVGIVEWDPVEPP